MRANLDRFIAYGEDVLRRADRGDWDALMICGVANLTAISVIVVLAAAALNWIFP